MESSIVVGGAMGFSGLRSIDRSLRQLLRCGVRPGSSHRGAALVSFHLPVIPLEKNRSKKPDPGFDRFAILKL